MSYEFETVIGEDVPVMVCFSYQPYEPPEPTYPGCDASVEIESVLIPVGFCGTDISDTLSKRVIDALEAQCLNRVASIGAKEMFDAKTEAAFQREFVQPQKTKAETRAHYEGELHKLQYNAVMAYWDMHKKIPLSTIIDQISRDLNQVISIKVIEQAKDVIEAFRKAGEGK